MVTWPASDHRSCRGGFTSVGGRRVRARHPGSGNDWIDLIKQVSPFSGALAPDIPGFGNADKPDDFDYP